ncbi:MAG TPA: GNAT family N-acetyltransferase [Thermoanaerobaculia bacterium]|nr:GNAT family N-acetyltransferase [Thermoanaerobaculia bacterium]HUM30226.1 GNAT family N-acetyltransferase [Thermoanaerobaculia bacterium]HXK68478.1 GNAT family N-acetyltransferase [Thermoanaerobaculia bacterium]
MVLSYPKSCTLRDGRTATIRLLSSGDGDKLYRLFMTLKPESRRFLYDDVTDRRVVDTWIQELDYDRILPLVVELDGTLVADGTLHRKNFGPLRHVGRVRVVVLETCHGLGVGTILMQELIDVAKREGLKILSSTAAEYEEGPAIQTLKALGFRRAALVPHYLMDPQGVTHSMAILTKSLT